MGTVSESTPDPRRREIGAPKIRPLERQEIGDLWSIDRAEVVDHVYRYQEGELVLHPEHHDTRGWPPGEPGQYELGRALDQLQLKFLHVGRSHRGAGLGRRLFDLAVARARELGARRLYVSSTSSENTVRFYLRRGCRLTDEPDAHLFALEPEDIHLELDIPA
jgi:predicted N-acetyltransferase YhbS